MKRNILLYATIAILFVAIGIYFGAKRLEPVAPKDTAVTHLFAQSMANAQGQSESLSQWKGKHLVINFWATWCAPCVQEMPELSALQTEVANKNIQILGIGIDSPANIAEFSSKYKISYPLYIAGMSGAKLTKQFGNQAGGLPFTVLVGSDGQIRKTYLGRIKLEELRKDLLNF